MATVRKIDGAIDGAFGAFSVDAGSDSSAAVVYLEPTTGPVTLRGSQPTAQGGGLSAIVDLFPPVGKTALRGRPVTVDQFSTIIEVGPIPAIVTVSGAAADTGKFALLFPGAGGVNLTGGVNDAGTRKWVRVGRVSTNWN